MSELLLTDAEREAFATWKAQAAKREINLEVVEGSDGQPAYRVSRWNMTRTLDAPERLALFLCTMGVAIDVPAEVHQPPVIGALMDEFRQCLELSVDLETKNRDH